MSLPTEKLVRAYINLREKRKEIKAAYDAEESILKEKQDLVAKALVDTCKEAGSTILRTAMGTVTQTVKTHYWASNWDEFMAFVRENDAPELLEKRIAQTNFKEFIEKHPEKFPKGVNVDSKYDVVVRRAKPANTGE